MRVPTTVLAFVALAALAGCAAPAAEDGDTGRNVSVTVTNNADTAYDVRVVLATEPFDGVEITYRNGSTRRLAVDRIDRIPPARLERATDIAVEADPVRTRRYTLTGGTGTGATYTDVPDDTTVVYFLRARDGTGNASVGTVHCGGGSRLTELTVDINPDGSFSVTNACSGT
jgi:hypothetical protein